MAISITAAPIVQFFGRVKNQCMAFLGRHRLRFLGMVLLLGLSWLPRPADGTERPFFVDAAVNTRVVMIGQSFHAVITAGANRGLVQLPGEHAPIAGCQVMAYAEKDVSRKHAGFLARQGIYTLKAFELQRVTIPPLPIKIEWDNGNSETAYTAPVQVTVGSMHPEKGLHLINPRGPMPLSWTGLLVMGLGLIAVMVLLARLFIHQRGPKGKKRPSAQRMARQGLRLLSHSDMANPESGQIYFTTLSKVIRRYLSERYQLPALEWSRIAVLEALQAQGVEADKLELINALLQEADLVKFAMEPVSQERLQAAHALAELIIVQTEETESQEPR